MFQNILKTQPYLNTIFGYQLIYMILILTKKTQGKNSLLLYSFYFKIIFSWYIEIYYFFIYTTYLMVPKKSKNQSSYFQ